MQVTRVSRDAPQGSEFYLFFLRLAHFPTLLMPNCFDPRIRLAITLNLI